MTEYTTLDNRLLLSLTSREVSKRSLSFIYEYREQTVVAFAVPLNHPQKS